MYQTTQEACQFKRYCLVLFDDGVQIVRSSWIWMSEENLFCSLPSPKEHRIMLKAKSDPANTWKSYEIKEVLLQSDDIEYIKGKEKKWGDKGTVSDTDTEAKRVHIPVCKFGQQADIITEEGPSKRVKLSEPRLAGTLSEILIPCTSEPEFTNEPVPVMPCLTDMAPPEAKQAKLKVPCEKHCKHVEKWFEKVFEEMEIMKHMIRGCSVTSTPDSTFELPVTSHEDLDALMEALAVSDEKQAEFTRYINRFVLQSLTLSRDIKGVLDRIAPSMIWSQDNLTGKGKLQFPKVLLTIISSVMETNRQYRKENIVSKVSDVLKHMKQCCERDNKN